ncbi:MAG TPA: PAS domain-containing sensor histidine kinase [Candidatus Microsaccharimonas sp.]|nr:PAS domain-containing sensor histidine kinase [Candidatus Microsaccharimonas sp.]
MNKQLKQEAAERLVAEERTKTDALFTSIGDGAIATDEFGKITRINPAALKILGYHEQEALGEWFPNIAVIVDEDGNRLSLIDRPITRAFLTGQAISEKIYYLTKHGKRVPVSVTVSPMIYNGRPIGAIEVFRDVSLEYEIDRMKSEFISLASHQLRTPLSAIKTYAHMLIDGYMGELTPDQRRSLSTIIGASNRMNELISTLLNITRIESGGISIQPKLLSLKRLVEEVIKELEHTAQSRSISLTLAPTKNDFAVKTDTLIAKEIITNLASNAIKYTPDGGKVHLSLAKRGTNTILSVQDTGLGIPKEAQEQIFTKFFRAPNVVKLETSGTGLGLYLVKGLADQLGGKVWFVSEEHQGSTFYFSLPAKEVRKKTST